MKIYKQCDAEKYSVLVNDTPLSSHNPLRFRINTLEEIFHDEYIIKS